MDDIQKNKVTQFLQGLVTLYSETGLRPSGLINLETKDFSLRDVKVAANVASCQVTDEKGVEQTVRLTWDFVSENHSRLFEMLDADHPDFKAELVDDPKLGPPGSPLEIAANAEVLEP